MVNNSIFGSQHYGTQKSTQYLGTQKYFSQAVLHKVLVLQYAKVFLAPSITHGIQKYF